MAPKNFLISFLAALFFAAPLLGVAVSAEDVIPVTDSERILAAEGREITVEGVVSRTGETKTRSILFINFNDVKPGGFSAIIRQRTLAGDYVQFDPEFAAGLTGRTVRITGTASTYRNAPQIQIFSPTQIEFLD